MKRWNVQQIQNQFIWWASDKWTVYKVLEFLLLCILGTTINVLLIKERSVQKYIKIVANLMPSKQIFNSVEGVVSTGIWLSNVTERATMGWFPFRLSN